MVIHNIQAFPPSNHISVDYLPQENGYYCGPAVVQMVLSYVAVDYPSQSQLATEMETDPIEGVTYTNMMRTPFENREFSETHENTLQLDDLKENNNNGFLTIILIYFNATHEYQHYVVVIGYNATGISIHDPWPITWDQPEGRTTGADTFIPNTQLADLWDSEPSHWGLVIPYSRETGESMLWWQQYLHFLLIVVIAVAGVLVGVILVIKNRRSKINNGPVISMSSSKTSDFESINACLHTGIFTDTKIKTPTRGL